MAGEQFFPGHLEPEVDVEASWCREELGGGVGLGEPSSHSRWGRQACGSPFCGMKAGVGLEGFWAGGQGPGCVGIARPLMSHPGSPAPANQSLHDKG